MRARDPVPPARRARVWAARVAGAALTLAVGIGLGLGVRYAAAELGGSSSGDTTSASAEGCDPDGVAVGYDVRYDHRFPGYGVTAVRVLGIAPACEGAALSVELQDGTGSLLAGGGAAATISGTTIRLPLPSDVSAAAVQQVSLTIDGTQQTVPPPVVNLGPPSSTTTPAVPAFPIPGRPPSLCPTVSGEITVRGLPEECGAVAAARVTGTPIPVASWPANVFSEAVHVTLTIPTPGALPLLRRGATGSFVHLSVVRVSDGTPVDRWNGVMAIDFPAPDATVFSAHSEDGETWTSIPRLGAPSLPDGQGDGYFVHDDRTVTIYTRHATFFSIASFPAKVARLHAKLVPSGAVRLTWTPAVAGLGIASYRVLRGGVVFATVPGTRTIALLRLPFGRSTLRVVGTDPLGHASPPSGPVVARVPVIVGARVTAPMRARNRIVTLSAAVRLTTRAGLHVLVLNPQGQRLEILPGSLVARAAIRSAARSVRVTPRPRGTYSIRIRLRSSELYPGGAYRLVVMADERKTADRAEIRFRARADSAGDADRPA